VRELKLTASNAQTIMANGKGLETYCKELVAEYLSEAPKEHFTSPDIERGNLLEAQAREYCSLLTGIEFEEVGFIEVNKHFGVSPDGVVFKNGKIIDSIEIKCHSDRVFLELLLTEEIDPKYLAQMQMQMLAMKTKSCIYFAYNPNIKPFYFMQRIKADKEKQEKLKNGIERGSKLIEEYLNVYKSKADK
jgi:hypothetical protein